MARGDPPTSPWKFYDSGGDASGLHIWAIVTFDGTNTLTGGIGHRDAGCQWTKVYLGLGPDGTPQSSPRFLDLTNFSGDHSFTANQLAVVGLHAVADVQAIGNITVA